MSQRVSAFLPGNVHESLLSDSFGSGLNVGIWEGLSAHLCFKTDKASLAMTSQECFLCNVAVHNVGVTVNRRGSCSNNVAVLLMEMPRKNAVSP